MPLFQVQLWMTKTCVLFIHVDVAIYCEIANLKYVLVGTKKILFDLIKNSHENFYQFFTTSCNCLFFILLLEIKLIQKCL